MSIAHKILLGLTLTIMIVLGGSLYTYSATTRLTEVIGRVLAQELPALEKLARIQLLVNQIHTAEVKVLSGTAPSDREKFQRLIQEFPRAMDGIVPLRYVPHSTELVELLHRETTSLMSMEGAVGNLKDTGNLFDAREVSTDAVQMRTQMIEQTVNLANLYKSYVEQTETNNLATGELLRRISILVGLVGTLLAVFITVVAIQTVLSPLERLVAVTESIARGKLDESAADQSSDEFGRLGRSFNLMVGNLRQRIDEVAAKNLILREAETTFEQQLRLARHVQKGIIPRNLQVEGLDVFGRIQAAQHIGGDFYDVHRLGEGGTRVGLLIGDASGHGIPAALLMVLSLVTMREAILRVDRPDEILKWVNQRIREHFPEEMVDAFVTAAYAVVDLKSKRLYFSNAGHEPPLLWRARDGSLTSLRAEGYFLSILEDGEYGVAEWTVEAGDKIIMCTDGVVECRSPDGEFFGKERLEALITEHGNLSCTELGERIFGTISEFHQRPLPTDDCALLIAEILPERMARPE